MEQLILQSKDLVILLWNVFKSILLLWLISHIFIAIIKTLFCDVELKYYRVWKKKLKEHLNSKEIKKYLERLEKELSEKV